MSKSVLDYIKPGIREQSAYRVALDSSVRIKINQNENPFDWPDEIKRSLIRRFEEISWNRYPNDQPVELLAALAQTLGIPEENILIGNGSNELTMSLGAAIVGKDTPVVLPSPMFSLYEKMVRTYEGSIIDVQAKEDLGFDLERILEAVRKYRPHLTVVCSPNNPSGRAMRRDDLLEIVEAAQGFVLIDEAYVEFIGDGSGLIRDLDTFPNLILMRTFSKAFGLAGLRIGYLMGNEEVIQTLMKGRLPFMIDRFAEMAAVTLLQYRQIVDEWVRIILAETRRLYREMKLIPEVEVLPTEANFLLFRTSKPADDVMAHFASEGILVRNMGGYTMLKGYTRVSTGTPEENDQFLRVLGDLVEKG